MQICDLADKYNAIVFVDECHATGFMGPTGRGTPELLGVEDRVDIVNSTLGKVTDAPRQSALAARLCTRHGWLWCREGVD